MALTHHLRTASFTQQRRLKRCARSARAHSSPRAADEASFTLYGCPGSRTQIVEWACLEFALPFDTKTLSRADMQSEAYREIHPWGKIPAATIGGNAPLFESGALVMYVGDKAQLMKTPEERGIHAAWSMWANATFWPAMETRDRASKLQQLLPPLETRLSEHDYLVGDEIGVADVTVAAYLFYGQLFFGIQYDAFPGVKKYVERIAARPHFRATVAGG
mmetsp:Transcript_23110/g.75351  ORF Transcript_23110/g.75351 Transcript_23110/m.75351 type:complete len:219 (-) Transcript_23110:115-771(-)|eukprot:CAMPEP_0170134312 /NCGR_PEP_ID=MMETSP0033_2-20121228/1822_1 /TAXON_ID=195969 /ORGANISM="Dolichomastix tenuilepis, Strain CCMP3274" /LENGTH=218 /DNA_ID=CAMNT_0010369859 /DNA_START=38 /DNA_END=694 /DNA_ORIENTATION=+